MVKRCPNVIADELSLPRTQSLHTMNRVNSHVSLQDSALNTLNMDQTKKLHRSTRPKPECKFDFLSFLGKVKSARFLGKRMTFLGRNSNSSG